MKVIHRAQITPSEWSGGRTWEFLIAPDDASYAARVFELRISSASVDTPTSTFTTLPGVDRWLAVCSPIELTINRQTRTLLPGEIVAFHGEDDVTSVGTCRDLNIMARRGTAIGVAWEKAPTGPAILLTEDGSACIMLEANETTPQAGVVVRRI